MAYDAEGKYFFDPMTDSEDAALLDQTDKMGAAMQYKQGQIDQQAAAQNEEAEWNQAFEESGLTREEFFESANLNPEEAQKDRLKAKKYIVSNAAARKGKKATPTQTETTRTQSPQRKVVDNSSRETRDRLKDVSNKRLLTPDEEFEAVEAGLKGMGI